MVEETRVPVLAVLRSARDFEALERILKRSNWKPVWAQSIGEAVRLPVDSTIGVIVCEARLADGCWQDLAAIAGRQSHPALIVVASRLADDSLWTEVLTHGAYDLVAMPFDERAVYRTLAQAWRQWKAVPGKDALQVA